MKKDVTREDIIDAFSGLVENPHMYNGYYRLREEEEGLVFIVHFTPDMVITLHLLRVYERIFQTDKINVEYSPSDIRVVMISRDK